LRLSQQQKVPKGSCNTVKSQVIYSLFSSVLTNLQQWVLIRPDTYQPSFRDIRAFIPEVRVCRCLASKTRL
jgi:hypothetical protein